MAPEAWTSLDQKWSGFLEWKWFYRVRFNSKWRLRLELSFDWIWTSLDQKGSGFLEWKWFYRVRFNSKWRLRLELSFDWIWTSLDQKWSGFLEWKWFDWVWPGFTELNTVIQGLIQFWSWFYRILIGLDHYWSGLLGWKWFNWVLQGWIGSLPSFTGFFFRTWKGWLWFNQILILVLPNFDWFGLLLIEAPWMEMV